MLRNNSVEDVMLNTGGWRDEEYEDERSGMGVADLETEDEREEGFEDE